MRTVPSFVQLVPVKINIDGHEIDAVTCSASCRNLDLYHFTRKESLRSILDNGFLKGMTGERESGHISFTINPNLFYTGGNIRIIFKPSVCQYLKPMAYYEEEKFGEIVEKIIADRREETPKVASRENRPTNQIIAEIGLMPRRYIYECEWYTSRAVVPVNKENVTLISYLIPWTICSKNKYSRCDKQMLPSHSTISYDKGCSMERMIKEISRVRKMIQQHGFKFSVDSSFPFIHDWNDGKIIILDDENLRRLSIGENVIYSDLNEEEATKKFPECRY